MSVKRYDLNDDGQMTEMLGGNYYHAVDYKVLEAERDRERIRANDNVHWAKREQLRGDRLEAEAKQLWLDRDTLAAKLAASEKRSESYRSEMLAWNEAGKRMIAAIDASGALQRAVKEGGGT